MSRRRFRLGPRQGSSNWKLAAGRLFENVRSRCAVCRRKLAAWLGTAAEIGLPVLLAAPGYSTRLRRCTQALFLFNIVAVMVVSPI
jgi:hypothetical protein